MKIDAMWKYVINAYLLFWVMIMGLGGLASMVFHAPDIVMKWIAVVCSWSPTVVLLLMLNRLRPGTSIRDFYRNAFRDRLRVDLILYIPVLVVGIFFLSVWILSTFQGTSMASRLDFVPSAFLIAIPFTILQGPTGEESGWRGYLRPELEGRFGFIKGNLILGVVWAFWHTPLWFVSSDYSGLEALVYIFANIVVMVALTIMMGMFLRMCNNLLLAVWIHFCFNISLGLYSGDADFFVVFPALYLLAASAFVWMYRTRHGRPTLSA